MYAFESVPPRKFYNTQAWIKSILYLFPHRTPYRNSIRVKNANVLHTTYHPIRITNTTKFLVNSPKKSHQYSKAFPYVFDVYTIVPEYTRTHVDKNSRVASERTLVSPTAIWLARSVREPLTPACPLWIGKFRGACV